MHKQHKRGTNMQGIKVSVNKGYGAPGAEDCIKGPGWILMRYFHRIRNVSNEMSASTNLSLYTTMSRSENTNFERVLDSRQHNDDSSPTQHCKKLCDVSIIEVEKKHRVKAKRVHKARRKHKSIAKRSKNKRKCVC